MKEVERKNFKIDPETKKRAFSILFRHLILKKEIDIGEVFRILSGVRLNGSKLRKVPKCFTKKWLSEWHKLGLITITRGKVRPSSYWLVWRFLDKETLEFVQGFIKSSNMEEFGEIDENER